MCKVTRSRILFAVYFFLKVKNKLKVDDSLAAEAAIAAAAAIATAEASSGRHYFDSFLEEEEELKNELARLNDYTNSGTFAAAVAQVHVPQGQTVAAVQAAVDSELQRLAWPLDAGLACRALALNNLYRVSCGFVYLCTCALNVKTLVVTTYLHNFLNSTNITICDFFFIPLFTLRLKSNNNYSL